MSNWFRDAIFYHIYPLGLCSAPAKNNFDLEPVSRLKDIYPWISHMSNLGVNALYIGPLFESLSHGYDTVDYFMLDRRLGVNQDLTDFVAACHSKNIMVILDAVFNHVSREHFAFRDVLLHGHNSSYADWFFINYDQPGQHGDPFTYEGWNGFHSLVKLNLNNTDVRNYLLSAVEFWMDKFGIDGLRLDAADVMEKSFFNYLHSFCKSKRNDFWLMGEVIHGDYNEWVNPVRLDSVTNYECYKGLWSSLNDGNYFEISYALNRQFGDKGIYKNLSLYNFADNHDVDRVASKLKESRHLYPLYILLFTMPGIPSIYYGSEWGLQGVKGEHSDAPLRPAIDLNSIYADVNIKTLESLIKELINIRKKITPLRMGSYTSLYVASLQFVFMRECGKDKTVIALNASIETITTETDIQLEDGVVLIDRLNNDEEFIVHNGKIKLLLNPTWGRILEIKK